MDKFDTMNINEIIHLRFPGLYGEAIFNCISVISWYVKKWYKKQNLVLLIKMNS